MVSPAAGESIAGLARAVRDSTKVKDISQMVYAYPTFTEGYARAANEWWNEKLFTPRASGASREL